MTGALPAERTAGALRVLLCDDEPPARRGLRALLDAHADIAVVGEARSGAEAVAAIRELKPQVVFLDVRMPEGDGFEVIRSVGVDAMPVVVFTTAYDEYAVQAFDAHAVDYLLKPFDRSRFEQALARARAAVERGAVHERLIGLLDRLGGNGSRWLQRVTVRQGTRTQFVAVQNIEVFEAEANYVRLWVNDKSTLVRDTLAQFEAKLDPAKFRRVHRSLIVQLGRVIEAESMVSGEYVLTLASGRRITTGRTFRSAVQEALGL